MNCKGCQLGFDAELYQGKYFHVWEGKAYPCTDQATHQLCCMCDQPTGRTAEDSMYSADEYGQTVGPFCEECLDKHEGVSR